LAIASHVNESAKFTTCLFLLARNADDQESSACSAPFSDGASPVRAEALLDDALLLSLLCEVTEGLLTFTRFGVMWHLKSYARKSQRPCLNHIAPPSP
jgi:hypothetical protein